MKALRLQRRVLPRQVNGAPPWRRVYSLNNPISSNQSAKFSMGTGLRSSELRVPDGTDVVNAVKTCVFWLTLIIFG